MEKLKHYCFVPHGIDISLFKKEMNELYPCEFVVEEIDTSVFPWTDTLIDYNVMSFLAEKVFKQYANGMDLIHVFTATWNRPGIIGYHHQGAPYKTLHLCVTKVTGQNHNLSTTPTHETMHAVNDIVYTYSGVWLEDILGVINYDEDVVHGRAEAYRRGHYEKAMQLIAPHLSIALARKRRLDTEPLSLHNLWERLIIAYRLLSIRDNKKFEDIYDIPVEPVEAETVPPPSAPPTTLNLLERWAEAIKSVEGWFVPNQRADYPKGSRSFRNNNPGNLRSSKFQTGVRDGFAYFQDYETGWKALLFQLRIAADGRSKVYRPDMTLAEFFAVYAPSGDGNNPHRYAKQVATYLGIPVDTKIKTLV